MGNRLLKKIIYKLTPNSLIDLYQAPLKSVMEKPDPFVNLSYSQEGEDLILRRIFEGKKNGFFVDVGAHHPKRFSNTYLFYKIGWRGINIDAMPGSMKEFNRVRPDDINIEYGISDVEEESHYYIFNEPALNTFSKDLAKLKDGFKNYRILDIVTIKLMPLNFILEQYLSKKQEIDFLNIDVEGLDYKVLKSFDFEKWKPKIILIEDCNSEVETIKKSDIDIMLTHNNYSLLAKTKNTLIYENGLKFSATNSNF
ncbi:FkbM family methyltransferase [Zunongwangia sp. H14]|uniref:FkbM family methyltransferase n=1 Tax=Zunongwangia sp. H14 TaxID=3240792 RepID=UPI0035640FD8